MSKASTLLGITFLAAVAAICILCADTPAHAYFKVECSLITALKPLSDDSGLSSAARTALAALRDLVAADRMKAARPGAAPPAIYDFSTLFIAIDPAADKDQPFGTRRLTAATRINGVTHTAQHDVTSPRYYFSTGVNSQIVTRLLFFGASQLDIVVSGPYSPGPTDDDRIAINTIADQPDLEKSLCDSLPDSAPAK